VSGATAPWGDRNSATKGAAAGSLPIGAEDDLGAARGLITAMLLSVPLCAGIVLALSCLR